MASIISNQTQIGLYFVLASLAVVFGVLVAVPEIHPPNKMKLWQVIVYADRVEMALFSHAARGIYSQAAFVLPSERGALYGHTLGRAYIIVNFITPWTPLTAHRDPWNAVGVGCTNAMKWLYA